MPSPATKIPTLYVHNDDLILLGTASLRGHEIDRVNLVAIDQEKHDAREHNDLVTRIARHRDEQTA